MKVIVAQLGARMHYAVPRTFYEQGMLVRLYTDIYIGNKPWLEFLMRHFCFETGIFERFSGRSDPVIPPEKVMAFDLLGLMYWIRQKKVRGQELHRVFAKGGMDFCRAIIKSGLPDADIVYGFQTASLELFEHAKSNGMKCILEQTIAPQRIQNELISEEKNNWDGWEDDMGSLPRIDSLAEREEQEWQLADLILCGSEFVLENLRPFGVMDERLKVVNYGVDLQRFVINQKERLKGRPLRVLFVGAVGLRKGIPYLLEALRILNAKKIEAKIAGKVQISSEIVNKYRAYADFIGSVPRGKIIDLYQWADVLVIPAICEGSAIVTYEALASGIPVICTPNTGSIVRDGIDGYVVPIRSQEAIASAIERYLMKPEQLWEHHQNAVQGRDRVGLEAYKNRLFESIRTTFKMLNQI